MGAAARWLAIIAILLGLIGPAHIQDIKVVSGKWRFQGTDLSLESPSACPSAGCAPGQRLNFQFEFELASYDPTPTDPPSANVKVCFYAPNNWVDLNSVSIDTNGGITGIAYQTTSECADADPPSGYQLIAAREAIHTEDAFGDSLGLALRLASTASAPGTVYGIVLEHDAFGWTETQSDFTNSLPVTPFPGGSSINVYVAASGSECNAGNFSPCYINSGDDLANGLGTGLKDAVDVVPDGTTVSIVGNYLIKSNTVVVNKRLELVGASDSNLSYSGNTCTSAMLSLRTGITLRDMEINGGSNCTTGHRTLIEINSTEGVIIEYNTLTKGDRGINIVDNTGSVIVRYNRIEENYGSPINWENGSSTASLEVIANNIIGNGSPIECASGQSAALNYRKANHNYWGSTTPPTQESTHCTIVAGKQLGAPIAARSDMPGLTAEQVTVTTEKAYSFDDEIAYQRTSGDSDFGMYIINHGFAVEEGIPFLADTQTSPAPCSNYWDVFLADGAVPNGTLELYLTYDKTSACIAAVNSNQFCGQISNTALYPLWWYDPVYGITDLWDTTGQDPEGENAGDTTGQKTECHTADNEIQVSIDSSGRPNLSNDLNYTPLMVGIEIIDDFSLAASSNNITVNWSTNNEPDITGFYVLRRTDGTDFSPITDLITRKGSALAGSNYQYVDGSRTSGDTYYYQIEIVRSDGNFLYSTIESITATSATATNTPQGGRTATRTRTPGPSPTITIPPPTRTNTPTLVPTQEPTRIPSITLTSRPPTATQPGLTLGAETRSPDSNGTPQPPGSYPGPGETASTKITYESIFVTRKPTTTYQPTVSPTVLSADEKSKQPRTVARNLMLGFSCGMVSLGLVAIWFFFLRLRPKT